jgi:hypothetical protein
MAQIPEALVAALNVYKLLMENDRVRVLDVRVKPGEIASVVNVAVDRTVGFAFGGAPIAIRAAPGLARWSGWS